MPWSDAITPITRRFLSESIEAATLEGADAIVIELDTPGGLVASTKELSVYRLDGSWDWSWHPPLRADGTDHESVGSVHFLEDNRQVLVSGGAQLFRINGFSTEQLLGLPPGDASLPPTGASTLRLLDGVLPLPHGNVAYAVMEAKYRGW